MDNKVFYEVYIKNGKWDLLKVLFYYDDVEFYKEDEEQERLAKAFMEKWWGKNDEILMIEKAKLNYFDCVK